LPNLINFDWETKDNIEYNDTNQKFKKMIMKYL
jgi:hypothetical protein